MSRNHRGGLTGKLYGKFFGGANRITESFRGNGRNEHRTTYPSHHSFGDSQYGVSGDWGYFSGAGYDSQLAQDEALARHLQEIQDEFDSMSMAEGFQTATGRRGSSDSETSFGNRSEDDVDPDNMTYQELNELAESNGKVSHGLSKEKISKLPSYVYKRTMTSEDKECAICKAEYEEPELLITLPCTHKYHGECIEKWLEENKVCCICKEEVHVPSREDSNEDICSINGSSPY